jgi:hypothetical protein
LPAAVSRPKSGFFQLESCGLRDPERIDRLLLVNDAASIPTGSWA